MSKKTVVFLVGMFVFVFVGIAVYAANDTGQTLTNDTSITNAEIANTEACNQDCGDDCDGDCEGHAEGRMCGGHGDGDKCGGHGDGGKGCGPGGDKGCGSGGGCGGGDN